MSGLQGSLVCQTESFQPFDGSDMAKRINDYRILAFFLRRHVGREHLTLLLQFF